MAKAMTMQQAVRTLGHPLRVELLTAYAAGEVSPSDLADTYEIVHENGKKPKRRKVKRLGPIGNVSYHTRILSRLGAVKLTRTAPVRGAVEHYYEATDDGRKALALMVAWETIANGSG